jgi:DNA-binding transcriptional LysR family regulator
MLRDFSKIETFLAVVKEKSFSKASKKLGISQPAVTQQIKLLEEYLEMAVVDRKKNGIRLTKEGEEVHRIVQRLEKHIANAEKELMRVMNKQLTFIIGASFTIGNYILPDFLGQIKEVIHNDVMVKVDESESVLERLLDKKVDVALIEHPFQEDAVAFKEWMEDELVLVSKSPLPKLVKKEELYHYDWICREEGSLTRSIITEAFHSIGVDCQNFSLKGIVTSSTLAKQTILKSSTEETPLVSIVSKHIVEHEVEHGLLYIGRVKGLKLTRPLYLVHLKERKNDPFIENVCNFIMSKKRLKVF